MLAILAERRIAKLDQSRWGFRHIYCRLNVCMHETYIYLRDMYVWDMYVWYTYTFFTHVSKF